MLLAPVPFALTTDVTASDGTQIAAGTNTTSQIDIDFGSAATAQKYMPTGVERISGISDPVTVTITNSAGDLRGTIPGSRNIVIQGSNGATTTLVGSSSYTGSTTIGSGGTLRIANNEAAPSSTALTVNSGGTFDLQGYTQTVGSVSGAGGIALGAGSLSVGKDNSDTTFSGTISGTGSFTKQGTGTLTLTGGNTYSGGTTISSGILKGSTTGLQGNIANNGTLTFDQSNDGTYGGVISGSGSVTKTGSGSLILTGRNTYSGGTTLSAGTLRVNGSVTGLLTVMNGGTLGGTGTVGNLNSYGAVGPGNSIGTLTVYGNYTQHSTGTLQIEISPTQADKLVVSQIVGLDKQLVGGAASLDGGLEVFPLTGTYTAGTKYPILTAQSVSGTFKSVAVSNSDRLGGLSVGVNYLSNEVDLELMAPLAASARQQEESVKVVAPEVTRQAGRMQTTIIGAHIASILFPPDFARAGGSKTGTSAPVGGPGDPDKKKDRKSSDAGTSGLAAGDAPAAADYDLKGLSAWGDASLALLNNTDAASKYNGLHKAATLGTDYRIDDQLVVGVAFTPDQADINLRSIDGNRTSTGISGAAYAGYKFDDTYAVSAIAGYGRAFNFSRQPVAGVEVKDNYNTNRYLAQLSASAAYLLQDDLRVIPSLSYTHSVESESRHHSSDGADIKIPTVRLGTVKAGAQLDYAVTEQIVPFVTGGIERDLINSGGSGRRLGFSAGGGVQVPLDDNLTLGAVATTNFGRGAQTETQFAANIRYSW